MKKDSLSQYYFNKLAEQLANSSDIFTYCKNVKYRKKTITKYLSIPTLSIEKDYNDYNEDGDGEFRGLLFSIKYVQTKIPIGKEVISVPVRRKFPKNSTIRFKRYGDLIPTKEDVVSKKELKKDIEVITKDGIELKKGDILMVNGVRFVETKKVKKK